jgi:predicted HTH transcriptional regulator
VAAREHGRVTVRDIQRLTAANRNTIKAHLKRLVHLRQLTQEGQGKGTWYRLSHDSRASVLLHASA